MATFTVSKLANFSVFFMIAKLKCYSSDDLNPIASSESVSVYVDIESPLRKVDLKAVVLSDESSEYLILLFEIMTLCSFCKSIVASAI